MELQQSSQIPTRDARAIVTGLEAKIRELPDAMGPECFPLEHSFAHGLYVRQVFVPKGVLIISKIHRFSHAAFLLQGEISIFGTEGITRRLKAPTSIITPAGTKRAVYHHEDTVFATVHATVKTDLAEIEEEIIAKSFDEVDDFIDVEYITGVIREMEGIT